MDVEKHNKRDSLYLTVAVTVVVIGIAIGFWIFSSSQEAAAYNRLTGSNVSTWDAMWVRLRVQDAPQKDNRD